VTAVNLMDLPMPPGSSEAGADEAPRFTVLCVDDEPNILSSLKRALRGPRLNVLTALSGAQALELLQALPIDVIISDMRMPEMDGAQLLEQVRQRWPRIMRILLTGHADMGSTVAAINRGGIFRYLQKPWDITELTTTVEQATTMLELARERDRLEALTQHQNAQLQSINSELEQRVAERTADLELSNGKLRRNYLKSIKVFSNLLELRGGALGGHGRRVADVARNVARAMGMDDESVLQVFVAGLLHDIGWIGVSDKLLDKPVARYSADEQMEYREHAVRGEQSLLALDDMQPVMALVRSHHERFDGQGFPDKLAGAAIPLGARILAVADAYDDLQNGHLAGPILSAQEARTLLRQSRGTQFDPEVLDVFLHITEPEKPKAAARLMVSCDALEPDMVLASDLTSARGVLMLTAGHRLTLALIRRIREFEQREGSKLELHIKPRGAT
jgi:response regulator RpfG family c-di-GMP phosphodiesterase